MNPQIQQLLQQAAARRGMQLPQDSGGQPPQSPTPQNGVPTQPQNTQIQAPSTPQMQDNSIGSMIPLNTQQGAPQGQNTGNGGQPAVNEQIDLIAAKSLAARLKKAETV